jgi:hypothetical protein
MSTSACLRAGTPFVPRPAPPPARRARLAGVMRSCAVLGWLATLWLAVRVPAASAQEPAGVDSGMFVVLDHETPVANEHFRYQTMGDSLMIASNIERQFLDEKGQRYPFRKRMVLVVDAHDLGLQRYTSNQEFQDHKTVRGLLPGDTVMTYFTEIDGAGTGDRVIQPPGRLFVLDQQLFTLFDVLCRSLAGKEFVSRRVQLVTLAPDSLSLPLATITAGKPDTLQMGSRRLPARRYALEDQGVRFDLWTDARGRMLRMANEPSGLSVVRVPDATPPPPKKRATPMH